MANQAPDLPDLIDGLFQLSFLLQACLARIAAEHDLSLVQVRLLGILRDREPGMLELARYLELEKSSLSGLVDRAENRGLVERIQSPSDRRATTIRVTARGRKLSRVIADAVRVEVDALVQPLPKADQDRLAALVRHVLPAGPA
ncbi:MAG TPA: MarR family transcriptional regulator [Kofleriaceae bacterium]|jgi:DNA-binding MarR family transcriptional regulator|nr:MarR family transcriptional regulator [Kofleriaceae bacterium]